MSEEWRNHQRCILVTERCKDLGFTLEATQYGFLVSKDAAIVQLNFTELGQLEGFLSGVEYGRNEENNQVEKRVFRIDYEGLDLGGVAIIIANNKEDAVDIFKRSNAPINKNIREALEVTDDAPVLYVDNGDY